VNIRWLAAAALLLPMSMSAQARSDHLIGIWGGPHAGAEFEGGLADLMFDCASGTIDDVIYPARDGSFSVKGTYRIGAPGPVKVGEFFRSVDAVFSGQITRGATKKSARIMTLNITLEDGKTLGPFTLSEGASPQISRCA
jgi:hypothetical protein